MTRKQFDARFKELYGHTITGDKPDWIVELAVRYGELKKKGGLRTQTEFTMAKLCADLDVEGVKAFSDIWKYMVVRNIEEARAAKRAIPKAPKVEVVKASRPTARAAVIALLSEVPPRSDEQIIMAVRAATFHDGFNQSQLSWYRSQFRQGRLKGQGALGPSETARKAVPGPKKAISVHQAMAVAKAASAPNTVEP